MALARVSIFAAFVFCPKGVLGGELVVHEKNGEVRKIVMDAGKIVGGKWAQHPHCNEMVLPGYDRRSWLRKDAGKICGKSVAIAL